MHDGARAQTTQYCNTSELPLIGGQSLVLLTGVLCLIGGALALAAEPRRRSPGPRS